MHDSDQAEGSDTMSARSSRTSLESSDGVIVQPDSEVVEAVVPFHEVNSAVDEPARSEIVDNAEVRQSDWFYLYVIFGICSVLALACYRRGAT